MISLRSEEGATDPDFLGIARTAFFAISRQELKTQPRIVVGDADAELRKCFAEVDAELAQTPSVQITKFGTVCISAFYHNCNPVAASAIFC